MMLIRNRNYNSQQDMNNTIAMPHRLYLQILQ